MQPPPNNNQKSTKRHSFSPGDGAALESVFADAAPQHAQRHLQHVCLLRAAPAAACSAAAGGRAGSLAVLLRALQLRQLALSVHPGGKKKREKYEKTIREEGMRMDYTCESRSTCNCQQHKNHLLGLALSLALPGELVATALQLLVPLERALHTVLCVCQLLPRLQQALLVDVSRALRLHRTLLDRLLTRGNEYTG